MSSLMLAIIFSALFIAYCVETEFDQNNGHIELKALKIETQHSGSSKASAVTEPTKEENIWTSPTMIAVIVIAIVLLIVIVFVIGIAIILCCRGNRTERQENDNRQPSMLSQMFGGLQVGVQK